jgi:hypothetical protein
MADVTVIFEGWGRGTWSSGGFGSADSVPSASGQVGSVTVVEGQGATAEVAGYWGGGTWGQGVWGTSVSPELTSSVGSVNVVVKYAFTGVEASTAVGSVTAEAGADVPATGIAATGGVGSVTATGGTGTTVVFSGWGRGTWGEGAWGVSLGIEATGEVGSVVATGDAIVPPSGLEATTNVGSVTVTGGTGIDVPVTAPEIASAVGQITMTGDANVYPTGIAPIGEVGTVEAKGIAIVNLVGLSATGEVTRPAVEGDAIINVTGVEASGTVGSVLVWDRIDPDATVVWTEIAVEETIWLLIQQTAVLKRSPQVTNPVHGVRPQILTSTSSTA